MAKIKSVYICEKCGYESPKWMGKCPDCNSWNTFEEELVEKKSNSSVSKSVLSSIKKPAKKLVDVTSSKSDRITTGIKEFDRVMGLSLIHI